MKFSHSFRSLLASCTALTIAATASPALAQAVAGDDDSDGLDVIIVTAQKREQSLQDVPIAVTALAGESLEANRVQNVVDLSGLAPGMTVYPSVGGSGIPIFAVRGQLSYGVATGSDKQTSLYLDGVYISSPRGSIFDLPDVERIEVLRGPQGTLFGRNATTGAVSINTREPDGIAAVKASASVGNYDYRRFRLTAETPQIGPFSAYFSYVHEQRDGDIENLSPTFTFDRTAAVVPSVAKINKTAETLGAKDVDTWFAALKFESGDFKTVYKYDRGEATGTPEATALVVLNRNVPLLGSFLGALVDSNGVVEEDNNGDRPDGVYNGWVIPKDQSHEGHSLTSTFVASDSLSFKSILGYRKSEIFATSSLDGFSTLPFTPEALIPFATFAGISSLAGQGVNVADPANGLLVQQTIGGIAQATAPLIGQPYAGIVSAAQSRSKQWSAELQANYESDFLTATVGGMYFKSKDYVAEHQLRNTTSFTFFPGGVVPREGIGQYFNRARSIAAFAQAELHLTPQLDLILGGRVTNDKKYGNFLYGETPANLNLVEDTYSDTRFNYLVGVNYKFTPDILLYAKYSTAYVAGGTSAGLSFEPETVKSAETGIKAEFLDNRLRTNVTLWWADVKHLQAPSAAGVQQDLFEAICARSANPACASDSISVFIADSGSKESWGLEAEVVAAPVPGLTLGGNASYTHTKVSDVPQSYIDVFDGNYDGRVNIPDWTAAAYVSYDTPPLFGDAYLSARVDAIWQDDTQTDANPDSPIFQIAPDALVTEAYWLVNGRVALSDIDLGGVNAQLAVWGRNLFDTQRFSYALNLQDIFITANYIPARTYGMDLTIDF